MVRHPFRRRLGKVRPRREALRARYSRDVQALDDAAFDATQAMEAIDKIIRSRAVDPDALGKLRAASHRFNQGIDFLEQAQRMMAKSSRER